MILKSGGYCNKDRLRLIESCWDTFIQLTKANMEYKPKSSHLWFNPMDIELTPFTINYQPN